MQLITLDTDDPRLRAAWEAVLDLSRRQPRGWTIIGAQMVALHAFEHGRTPPRRSLDIDVLVNIRLLQDGTERVARLLHEAGFALLDPDPFGVGHRFDNGRIQIDVLAPDGLSERSNRTTIPPAHTVSVPGGTQALQKTELVEVAIGDQRGQLPRPNLLGAILIKARAVGVDDVPRAQLLDLAFLLSLVHNPRSLGTELRRSERRWLRDRAELLDPSCSAWRNIDDADIGQRAYRLLSANRDEGSTC